MLIGFILAITVVLFFFIATKTQTELLNKAPDLQNSLHGSNITQVIQETYGQVPNAYQSLKWISFVLIIGMFLSIIITSFLIKNYPAFFVAYLLLWIIAIIISVPISNTYEEVYNTPELTASFSGFWGQTYIFLNLPVWIVIIGGIAGLIMFINLIRQSEYGGY